jgi:PAS domain S-box-containing protein
LQNIEQNQNASIQSRHLDYLRSGDGEHATTLWADQVGFWRMDVEADRIHWSNDWCKRLDLDPCIGPNHTPRWNERIHPLDRGDTDSYERLIEGASTLYEAEYRLRTLSGDWRWVLSRGCVAETNVLGEPSVIIGLTIDIDARKRAELALLESENRLALAVWGSALGVWNWDIDGDRCAWLNDWCASMDFDPCRGEPHGVSWNDNTHPDDRDRIERIDTDCHIGRRDTYEYEYRHRTTRGEWRWLLERGRVASRSKPGRATHITGVCMDITQRKENERKLHQYQERYFAVVQRVPGYVFEMRPSTDGLAALTWASDGLKRVFGCDIESYKQLGGWRRFWFAEDYDRSVDNLRKLLRGEPTEQSWRVRNLDGEERWIHAFYTPFLDPSNGKVDVILGVAHDVSERVQLERRVLNAAQQEQQRIASDLHDGLGQELTGIAMMLQCIVPRIQAIAPEEASASQFLTPVRLRMASHRSARYPAHCRPRCDHSRAVRVIPRH